VIILFLTYDVKNMSFKKRVNDLLHSDNYSYTDLNRIVENTTVLIFIINILLFIFLFILLILFGLSLWQIFFNPLLIEWNIIGVFISTLLGIIGVLLGILSILMSQAKDIEKILDSKNDDLLR
jgi:hypothetical protein